MSVHPVLIAGRWRPAKSSGTFRAENPATREPLDEFPISTWDDCDEALTAAAEAFEQLRKLGYSAGSPSLEEEEPAAVPTERRRYWAETL